MGESTSKGLLELLTESIGCGYLSNLHLSENRRALSRMIQTIPSGSYPLSEWTDAAKYLLEREYHFSSEEEAKRILCQKLTAE